MEANRLEYAERYAALGLSLQWVCGPTCDGASHGRNGHPPTYSGKIPLRAGWQRAGYRSFSELRRDHAPGNNLSVLTGFHDNARLCVVVVDLDSDAALAWGHKHLPPTPWRVKTRRGEHWYYRCTEVVASRDLRKTSLGLDMEVKGNGTHVVAASSQHLSGHVYAEVTERPWYAEHVRELPLFSSSWFPAPGHASASGTTAHEPKAPSGTWPGQRTFSSEDFHEAWERAILYLERCPPSRSGHGGDAALHDAALKLLRGWPLCTPERRATITGAAQVDAADAQRAAVNLLRAVYNPLCVDADGETPFPWDDDRLYYKVGQAVTATRLPGPDCWLFDEPEQRIKWAQMFKKMPPSAATDEGEQEIPMDETTTTSKVAQDAAESNAFAGLPNSLDARVYGSTEPVVDERPVDQVVVQVGTNLLKMATDAEKALAYIPDVYVMSGKIHDMVREVGADKHGYDIRPYCRPTPRGHLVALLSAYSRWVVPVKAKNEDDQDTERTVRPDAAAVTALQEAGSWPNGRRLHGIVYTPVVRADGTILQRPGYDYASGLYYHDELRMRPIQTLPTRQACADALRVLLDVISDFPFADPALSKAVWLSAVLTRFARHAFRGSVPMFVVSANVAGGGKGKLVDAAAIICDGRPAAKIAFHANAEEDERVITSHLRDSTPSVCLDNIDKDLPLASSAYEMLLTTPTFTSRVIKTSTMFRCEYPDATWWATGNGLRTAGDMSRRVLRIDIADMSGSPKDRKAKHADLEAYCLANRDLLVRAALTLLSGWYAAGKPQAQIVPLASYDAWSSVVRQCVVWCGLPDPGLALGKDSEDESASKRAILFKHLLKVGEFLPGQLAAKLSTDRTYSAEHSDLYSFLNEEGVQLMRAGKSDGKSFGRWLTPHVGPVEKIGGKRYILGKKATNAGAAYLVRELP